MAESCGLWPVLMSITGKAFGSVESMQHGDMADVSSTEKLCLSNYARKHVRYGSTARGSSMIREKYLKHNVQPNDTLQGLALRYGVTMEQIKRANKMWTTDSLFLYSTLDIPVYEEPLTVSSMSSSPPGSPDKGNDSMSHVSLDSSNHNSETLSPSVGDSMNSSLSTEESAADFLIRIDSHIAQQKDKVLKLQKRNVYSEDDLHNSRTSLPHSGFQGRRNSFVGSSSLSDLPTDIAVAPQPVVMTKGRKIKHSLKKLELQQDEIFEL